MKRISFFGFNSRLLILIAGSVSLAMQIGLGDPSTASENLKPVESLEQSRGNVPPATCGHIVRRNPNISAYWVKLDLDNTNIGVRVSRGGEDPDGSGPWETTLLPTTEIAAREHFDIAVNGDFFLAENTLDIEGKKTGYIRGKFAKPEGPAMTDGLLWNKPIESRPCLEITASNTVQIAWFGPRDTVGTSIRQIVGGGQIIVQNGEPVILTNHFAVTRNPRTAAGVDRTGKLLTLLVVDGRQPELSVGMTLHELSLEMVRLGCSTAINLDGGGSSTLVYRDPATQKLKVINSPSDKKERSVADVLGVTVKGSLPPAPDNS
jgi:hypothetical protein